jgi:drug/metabolite transporter (DMT)-like permease
MTARALAYLLICNALAGATYVSLSWTLRGFSAPAATFWRLLLAAACFAPFVWPRLKEEGISRQDWGRIVVVGSFGLAFPSMAGAVGMKHSSAVNAALLTGLEPIGILLLSAAFLGEAVSSLKIAALVLSLVGSSMIAVQGAPWALKLSPHWKGDLILIFSAGLWAIYTVTAKSALKRVRPLVFTAMTTAVGACACLPFALTTLIPVDPPALSLWSFAFQVVGITLVATLLWNKALALVPASTMANFVFLQPLLGVVFAALAGEGRLTGWSTAGGALIVAGVTLASR